MRHARHCTHLAGLIAVLFAIACRPAADTRRGATTAITLVDDAGRRVDLPGPARRMVSLLPSFTELLFAIGAGQWVVGRTAWGDYPPLVRAVPSVGDGMPPNVEAVAARRPDLVVLYRSGPNITAAHQLEELGISVVVLALDRLEDVGPAARALGRLTGRGATADSLANAFERFTRTPPPSPFTSLVFVVWDNPPIVIGGGSYLDRLAALAGARNVFHDIAAPSAQVSLETIARRDPNVVAVLSDSAAPPAFATRPEWRVVRAVRQDHVLPLDGSLFGRLGPRAPQAVQELQHRLEATQ